ncbi:hypothetical protein DOY81_008431, partial [Sarcophaga bullata]
MFIQNNSNFVGNIGGGGNDSAGSLGGSRNAIVDVGGEVGGGASEALSVDGDSSLSTNGSEEVGSQELIFPLRSPCHQRRTDDHHYHQQQQQQTPQQRENNNNANTKRTFNLNLGFSNNNNRKLLSVVGVGTAGGNSSSAGAIIGNAVSGAVSGCVGTAQSFWNSVASNNSISSSSYASSSSSSSSSITSASPSALASSSTLSSDVSCGGGSGSGGDCSTVSDGAIGLNVGSGGCGGGPPGVVQRVFINTKPKNKTELILATGASTSANTIAINFSGSNILDSKEHHNKTTIQQRKQHQLQQSNACKMDVDSSDENGPQTFLNTNDNDDELIKQLPKEILLQHIFIFGCGFIMQVCT